jgi:hypothetical protein
VSSRLVDAFTTPWTADPSGRFTVRSDPSAARFGADRRGLEVVATPGAAGDPPPFAEQAYAPALDLRNDAELRLWMRSTRAGDDGPARPAYLALEADTVPAAAAPWRRLVRIGAANRWELARLGLDDMPAPIRRAVGVLRLRSLDPEIAFTAALDDLLAVTPQPFADVDTALIARFSAYRVGMRTVAAILDLPEVPGTRTAPYLLITPWSAELTARPGAELVADRTDRGASVRPAPVDLLLAFRLDVYARSRAEKTTLLDRVAADLLAPLVVAGVAVDLEPFAGPPDPPGRTPLYVRLRVPVETGPRAFHPLAQGLLAVGHVDDRPGAEALPV